MQDLLRFGAPNSSEVMLPRAVQRQLEAVEAAGLIKAERLGVLETLIGEAANGIVRQSLLHEQFIRIAPLADAGLAELRQDHVYLARRIIREGLER